MSNKLVFKDYADYYDLLYKDKDYDAEVKYVDKLIRKFCPNGNKIIEFGSGTGIHGNLLTEYKYDIEGVELSNEMVKYANKSKKFNIFQGNMTSYVSPQAGDFDIALSLFHVVSYLTLDEDLNNFFKNANLHLKKNGILIFDTWHTPAVEFTPPETRVKRMHNSKLKIVRIAEPNIHKIQNIVDVNFTIFTKYSDHSSWNMIQESHPMRHFSQSEIEGFASQNNFKVLENEEFLTSRRLDKSVWGSCFVLMKMGDNNS